ncbi:MAG: UPF0146 family protein, partial [Hadesarchaea archaeon]|nr:UPF0146 family protein [Hadesarchaea archaeon]
FKAIAEYIADSYPNARKIVEVGIGALPATAIELSKRLPGCEIIATDISAPPTLPPGVRFERDDVTNPRLEVYEGAALVYAMRPPPELQPHLLRLARRVGADLIVKPLAAESVLPGGKLVNYRGVAFYLFKGR